MYIIQNFIVIVDVVVVVVVVIVVVVVVLVVVVVVVVVVQIPILKPFLAVHLGDTSVLSFHKYAAGYSIYFLLASQSYNTLVCNIYVNTMGPPTTTHIYYDHFHHGKSNQRSR